MSQTELQDIDCALQIGAQVQDRITESADKRALPGDMKDSVEAILAGILKPIKLRDIDPRVVRAGRNVTHSTGRFIINNHDPMTIFHQAVSHMGADEAGPSCD